MSNRPALAGSHILCIYSIERVLTHLLIAGSAALEGAATLLIGLCTLWFGLFIGVGTLLVFRFVQRVDISGEPEESREKLPGEERTHNYYQSVISLNW